MKYLTRYVAGSSQPQCHIRYNNSRDQDVRGKEPGEEASHNMGQIKL